MLNESIRYTDGQLHVDGVCVADITAQVGTPIYIYSRDRVLSQYRALHDAFSIFDAHIHYSAKANANLALMRSLVEAGAGIDAVSGGEIKRALAAGCAPEHIVFAGVGKTPTELRMAVEQGGWLV